MDKQLVYSALKTPDGTVLVSYHRHDYKTHLDKNGKQYMIDGGLDYVRCSINGDEDMLQVYTDHPFEVVRSAFHWGVNYTKDMQRLPETVWTPIDELKSDHIEAIIRLRYIPQWVRDLMEQELKYRKTLNL